MTDLPSGLTPLTRELIGSQFALAGSELLIGGLGVRELTRRFGSPLYVYDRRLLESRYRQLSQALQGFARVAYSIKANPQPEVAACFVRQGAPLEIASAGEFRLARAAGCAAADMLFAGPGKGHAELQEAIAGGIGEIHLESFEEIAACAQIAAAVGRTLPVAVRINPFAAAQGGAMRMGGKPAAFGFDEEQLAEVVAAVTRHTSLRLEGLHLYAGTQVLQAEVLLQQWRHGLELGRALALLLQRPLVRIDLGGGLGIPYHAGQTPLDMRAVQAGAAALASWQQSEPLLAPSQILVEPGRWLAGPAGVYLMTVRAVKRSRGQRFVICDGGMHHHLAASGNLGQVIKLDYPLVAATRMANDAVHESAQVVGPLCTPLDTLGRQTLLPEVQVGDIVAVLQSGAYGLTASPSGFLSHPLAAEVMVCEGQAHLLQPAVSIAHPPLALSR